MKRVGELQALSKRVASVADGMVVSYLPHFVAKTERADSPLSRSFRVHSLKDFAGDLEEGSLLCPVHAVHIYLRRTGSVAACPSSLFVSPLSPSRAVLKNAICFFLREVTSGAGAVMGDGRPSLESSQHSRCFHVCCFFCKTGWFPSCWRPQLGNRIQYLHHFILRMFIIFLKGFAPLDLSSLRVQLLIILNEFFFCFFSRFWGYLFSCWNPIPWGLG